MIRGRKKFWVYMASPIKCLWRLIGFACLNACGVWLASPVWMPVAFQRLRRLKVSVASPVWMPSAFEGFMGWRPFRVQLFNVQRSKFKQLQTISNNFKQLQTISNNLKQIETTSFTPSNTYPNPCKSVPCPCSDLWIPVSAYGRHRCRPSRGG